MLKTNNYSFKKIIFYLLTVFLLLALYVLLDFVFSNTLLKNENCYDYKSYKKGIFITLKKIVKLIIGLKEIFLSVKLYTDKLGLRVGKIHQKEIKIKIYLYLETHLLLVLALIMRIHMLV